MGDYHVPLNHLIGRTLNCKTIGCLPITKKTVEIGAKHSPDTVCTPFKIVMGQFIEALERGANCFIMPAFGCRLGFYDILHKQVLEDLGYKFEMLTLFDYIASTNKMFASLSSYNPELTREKFDEVLSFIAQIVMDMDWMSNHIRRNAGFEVNKGEFEKNYMKYLAEAAKLENKEAAITLGEKYKKLFNEIKIDKPEKPIRIGLVGDLYTVIEPHGNCEIVKWLISNGVEVVSKFDLTYLAATMFNIPALIEKSGGYVDYNIGGSANNNIALAYEFVNNGIDGIIHMKAETCTPEITAMTILQNISSDYDVPFMYLTFGTETGEAGMHTRWEAFLDMVKMRREEND